MKKEKVFISRSLNHEFSKMLKESWNK